VKERTLFTVILLSLFLITIGFLVATRIDLSWLMPEQASSRVVLVGVFEGEVNSAVHSLLGRPGPCPRDQRGEDLSCAGAKDQEAYQAEWTRSRYWPHQSDTWSFWISIRISSTGVPNV